MSINKNDFSQASRLALMELTMLGEYGVSDKVGVCECIENLSDEDAVKLASTIIKLDDDIASKKLLENLYHQSIQSKNSNVSLINESSWNNSRNMLLEADAATTEENVQHLRSLLRTGGIAAASAWLIKVYVQNPNEASLYMSRLKKLSFESYEKLADSVRAITKGKIIFPTAVKTIAAQSGVADAHAAIANSITQREKEIPKKYFEDLKKAKENLKKAHSEDLKTSFSNMKSHYSKVFNGTVIVATLGITALAVALVKLYQEFLSDAAKSCRSHKGIEKRICMLTHRISACNVAIQKCQQALGGCQSKSNPEKCIHSIQTQIWNWQRRKKNFEQKLARIGKSPLSDEPSPVQSPTQPPPPPPTQPASGPSGDGGGVF
jgi:hypothetical protein